MRVSACVWEEFPEAFVGSAADVEAGCVQGADEVGGCSSVVAVPKGSNGPRPIDARHWSVALEVDRAIEAGESSPITVLREVVEREVGVFVIHSATEVLEGDRAHEGKDFGIVDLIESADELVAIILVGSFIGRD